MNRMQISEALFELIHKELKIPMETIRGESKLMEDLGATSLDVMTLLPKIEETFNIEFSVRALRNMITIDDIVEYIEQQTKSV